MPDVPQQPPIRPMSRGKSRVFVIVSLVLVIAGALWAGWYLSRTAMENKDVIGADSSAVRGFGVTQY